MQLFPYDLLHTIIIFSLFKWNPERRNPLWNSFIFGYDAINRINPNLRYDKSSKLVATINSTSDADTFLNKYKNSNNYKYSDTDYLSLGNRIRINGSRYKVDWNIAGFDIADKKGNTTTNYGIGLIATIGKADDTDIWRMNPTDTTVGGYKSSEMNTTILPRIATDLQSVLGTHLIQRRISVSNAVDSAKINYGMGTAGCSKSSAWINTYCSLLTETQMIGTSIFGNTYDIGESQRKLPLFNFVDFNYDWTSTLYGAWVRSVASTTNFVIADADGTMRSDTASSSNYLMILIYIR